MILQRIASSTHPSTGGTPVPPPRRLDRRDVSGRGGPHHPEPGGSWDTERAPEGGGGRPTPGFAFGSQSLQNAIPKLVNTPSLRFKGLSPALFMFPPVNPCRWLSREHLRAQDGRPERDSATRELMCVLILF